MPSFKFIDPLASKKILNVFCYFSPGSHLVHVTWIIYTKIHSPVARKLHIKFDPMVSEEKMFKVQMTIYLDFALGRGR